MKRIFSAILAVCIMLTAAGCGAGSTVKEPEDAGQAAAAEVSDHTVEFSSEKTDWDENVTAEITMSDGGAEISGTGCEAKDGVITVTEKGTYVFSGSYTGQIRVDADGCKVRLVLKGADITSPDSCPVYIKDSKKTRIILAKGTENTLTDSSEYKEDGSLEEQPTAALFSKSDLILEGSGSLTVNARYKTGIRSKDTIEILSGSYTINSASHGVSGKDSVAIQSGTLVINSGGDGVRSTGGKDTSLGWIYISGGSVDIDSGGDGFSSANWFKADGGIVKIKAGGGSEGKDGGAKGIKAKGDIELTGSDIDIQSAGDGINADGSAEISGGTVKISTGDDGIHCSDTVSVSGGGVYISKCVEGIEGTVIELSGGSVCVESDDDGISAVRGGSDDDGSRFDVQEGVLVRITGGTLFVDSYGDGIDCNGDLIITGGNVVIDGPQSDKNGALDYNGKCSVTGGTLLAVGSLAMAKGTGKGTTMASAELSFSEPVPAGTLVSLTDSNGSVVVAYAARKDISSFIACAPGINNGATYKVFTGGECDGENVCGMYISGSLSARAAELGTAKARISDGK